MEDWNYFFFINGMKSSLNMLTYAAQQQQMVANFTLFALYSVASVCCVGLFFPSLLNDFIHDKVGWGIRLSFDGYIKT